MLFDEAALRALVADAVRPVVREELNRTAGVSSYISVQAAAERIDVAPATIRQWIGENKLGRYHAGRELRVKVAELEALVASEHQPRQATAGTNSTPEAMGVRDALRDMREQKRRRNE